MAFDEENDVIKDSAFPVAFTDDDAALDQYGVWVKSGPRDRFPSRSDNVSIPENDFPDLPDLDDLPEMDALADLGDLGDLPDLNDLPDRSESFSVEAATFDETEQSIDNISMDETASIEDIALPDDFSLNEPAVYESNREIVFDEVINDTLPLDEEIAESLANETAKIEKKEIDAANFNEIDESEFFDAFSETPSVSEPAEEETPAPVFSEQSMTDISFEDVSLDETAVDAAEQAIETSPAAESADDATPEDDISAITENFSAMALESSVSDFDDILADLNTESPAETVVAKDSPANTEVNLELDAFVDTVNDFGVAGHEDPSRLYEETEPVDLDLDFDESFIADAEKIRATGSAVTESEFYNSEFGVELVDESSESEVEISDELSHFVQKIGDSRGDDPSESVPSGDYEDTSEFDDLLQSLDLAPAPERKEAAAPKRAAAPNAFNLTVSEDEGLSTAESSVVAGDDTDVSLFGSVQGTEEEKLDIMSVRDYNTEDSKLSGDLRDMGVTEETVASDFDDVSALERELSDPTPETGDEPVVTNDKSTELLKLIADELFSIKNEITSLKAELSAFKNPETAVDIGVPPASDANSDNSGFFTDDDTDEAIALTGDELNNILITADFTEEKGDTGDETLAETEQSLPEDFGVSAIADVPGTEELELPVPAGDFSEEEEIPETLPDSIFDAPSLDETAVMDDSIIAHDQPSVDVSHVNKLDEDVSYLEGDSDASVDELDNVAIEEPDLEPLDFNDEKLEEPKLDEFNIDLTDIEQSFAAGQEVPVPESMEDGPDAQALDVSSVPDSPIDLSIPENETSIDLSSFDDEIPVADSQADEPLATDGDIPPSIEKEDVPVATLPVDLKDEIKSVLTYMDQLLESLPEEKIEEFARSEHFETYKKLFEELGIS